jgi:hypothetical protein
MKFYHIFDQKFTRSSSLASNAISNVPDPITILSLLDEDNLKKMTSSTLEALKLKYPNENILSAQKLLSDILNANFTFLLWFFCIKKLVIKISEKVLQ